MTTQKSLEVNSIAVHPDMPNRIFIATNVNGVMVSEDGGATFKQTNDNFTSRLTYSITADVAQEGRLYATTHNTASSGGFLFKAMTEDVRGRPQRGLTPTASRLIRYFRIA